MTDDRFMTASRRPEDVDAALRPKTLDDFVGQKAAREIPVVVCEPVSA